MAARFLKSIVLIIIIHYSEYMAILIRHLTLTLFRLTRMLILFSNSLEHTDQHWLNLDVE